MYIWIEDKEIYDRNQGELQLVKNTFNIKKKVSNMSSFSVNKSFFFGKGLQEFSVASFFLEAGSYVIWKEELNDLLSSKKNVHLDVAKVARHHETVQDVDIKARMEDFMRRIGGVEEIGKMEAELKELKKDQAQAQKIFHLKNQAINEIWT